MLRTTSMKRVLILVPRTEVDAVLKRVASLGALHLLDLSSREEWTWALRSELPGEERCTRQETLRAADTLLRFYAPPPVSPAPDDGLPAAAEAERQIAVWSAEMDALRAERGRLRAEVERLEEALRGLEGLAPSGLAAEDLRAMRRLHPACGWLPAGELERLEEALARIPHRVVVADAHDERQLVLAFSLARDRDVLARALHGLGWQPLALSSGDGARAEAPAPRLDAAREALASLEARFEALRLTLADPLTRARDALERDLLLLDACAFTARSQSVTFLAGWIPEPRVEALRHAVRAATGERCHVVVEDPGSIDRVRSGADPVPILFRNPALLRPFERLTAAYGAPRWRELDPTPIVAAAFWLMFGLMFGDVGHGATLGAAGLWIFRRVPGYRDYGVLLMECGVASIAFGFAYGSVFGVEHWLAALWFRPMEDVPRLLRAGASFGLLFLSLAFALGLLNTALRRDWRGALLGVQGLPAALSYWIAAALVLRWLATGDAGVGAGLALALVGAPLALLWAARIATELRPAHATPSASAGPSKCWTSSCAGSPTPCPSHGSRPSR
jgi:V/A-type H+-transporting ATPase subunit I